MAKETVGYSRLYIAIECSTDNTKKVSFDLQFGEITARVYIGRNPSFGVYEASTSKYVLAGGQITFRQTNTPELLSQFPNSVFTEIMCFKQVDIDQSLSDAIHADDTAALNEILDITEREDDT